MGELINTNLVAKSRPKFARAPSMSSGISTNVSSKDCAILTVCCEWTRHCECAKQSKPYQCKLLNF